MPITQSQSPMTTARLFNGRSMKWVSLTTGVPLATYVRIERGQNTGYPIRHLQKLVQHFNWSVMAAQIAWTLEQQRTSEEQAELSSS